MLSISHTFKQTEIVDSDGKVIGYHSECEHCSNSHDFMLDGSGIVKNRKNDLVAKFQEEIKNNPDTSLERKLEIMGELDAASHSTIYIPQGDAALNLEVRKVCRYGRDN